MKETIKYVLFCLILLSSFNEINAQKWVSIFNNKDLSGWDTFLVTPNKSVKFEGKQEGQALGFNNDPTGVYRIVIEDGSPAIRISGEIFGAIISHEEYENYHLSIQFKWGLEKWAPRENAVRDSGVLYHSIGLPKDGTGVWMTSQESQVQEGDCGDLWTVGKSKIDVSSKLNSRIENENQTKGENNYTYDINAEQKAFGQDEDSMRCIKAFDNENVFGEWNTMEIVCWGDKSLHIVNGKVVMALTNSRALINGKERPLTKGKIQIQSEGAEVFYREIKVKSIKKLPVKYSKYFKS